MDREYGDDNMVYIKYEGMRENNGNAVKGLGVEMARASIHSRD